MNPITVSDATPFVSILIPCYNESRYINKCIENVVAQDYPHARYELLILDGMSRDGTRDIVGSRMTMNTFIRLVDNPARIVSSGLNIGIMAARWDVIVRMDAHTEYASDYISESVRLLLSTGAENVGGPWRAVGRSYLQKAIGLAFQAAFSSGGASSHALDYEGEVDSVYLGCWKKATLIRIGLFDEELVRNQDDELNLRIIRGGGKVWQSPKIKSWYYPRSSITALFRQYMQYGYWKVRVIQKHRIPASFRHIVPGGFVALLMVLSLCSPFSSLAFLAGGAFLGIYLFCNLVASGITCRKRHHWKYFPVMPLVFSAYHFGYGYGFLRGVVDFWLLGKGGTKTFTHITRESA